MLWPIDRAEATRGPSRPIPVLLPYEGKYNPGKPATQVVLRQSDFAEIERLTKTPSPRDNPTPMLVEASHRVAWSDEHQVTLISDLVVQSRGEGQTVWRVPIARAREISATIDGHEVPVFIEEGGREAAVTIPGTGRFKIQIRRTVSATALEQTHSLEFPVNPNPSARLVLEPPADARLIRLLNARGQSKRDGDRSITAELGPTDRVEIRWGGPETPGLEVAGASAEGTLLWDVQPAGDRLRGRFKMRGPRPLSTVRFLLEPGLIPKSMDVPGLIVATWSRTAEGIGLDRATRSPVAGGRADQARPLAATRVGCSRSRGILPDARLNRPDEQTIASSGTARRRTIPGSDRRS